RRPLRRPPHDAGALAAAPRARRVRAPPAAGADARDRAGATAGAAGPSRGAARRHARRALRRLGGGDRGRPRRRHAGRRRRLLRPLRLPAAAATIMKSALSGPSAKSVSLPDPGLNPWTEATKPLRV